MDEINLNELKTISLDKVVKSEYRIYQIYTLMDRAIPYLQDGLKPSQRRILYTLFKHRNKGLVKVTGLTGLVLTLHPHGPASIETSIVNMAQDYTFSNNYPLIDKKGYFGERMETQAAAGRYIECRLGKTAEILLFDDMNQVEMVPNYDEREVEPLALLPKLPIMLLNGAEGIGTGFSSVIPSFNHKDIVKSMISCIEKGKPSKLKPWVRHYSLPVQVEKTGKIIFALGIEQRGSSLFITELPKGWDAKRVYRHLNKMIDRDLIKDYIDASVDNTIEIELLFKRGKTLSLEDARSKLGAQGSVTPNYTLISERGVRIFKKAEQIIELFTAQRLKVVKRRYELLVLDCQTNIIKNSEIIRFIKEKQYAQAEKKANRAAYVEYLTKKKFKYAEYLADMAIYRMTKEEVGKRELYVKDDKKKLKEYQAIVKSPKKVKTKLIEELNDVSEKLTKIMADKDASRAKTFAKKKKKKTKKR